MRYACITTCAEFTIASQSDAAFGSCYEGQLKPLDPLRGFFAAQRFKQLRQELAEGQHHQREAGILLTQIVVAAVLFSLILQQVFKLQALDHQLVVQHERQFVLPGQAQLSHDFARAQVQLDFVAGQVLTFAANDAAIFMRIAQFAFIEDEEVCRRLFAF